MAGAGRAGPAVAAVLALLASLAPAAPPVQASAGGGATITTLAGGGVGDGGPATAALLDPEGLAFTASGAMLIADGADNRVRRVGRDGVITTIAGTGQGAAGGDGGPATRALLSEPTAVATGPAGAVYIADTGNGAVRRVDASGRISTLLTTQAGAPDPELGAPTSVAVDSSGDVLVAGGNVIDAVSPSGAVTRLAGRAAPGYSPDGTPLAAAVFDRITSIAVGGDGQLFIVDSGNHCIRVVGATAVSPPLALPVLQTVAGTCTPDDQYGATVDAVTGDNDNDGGAATAARLSSLGAVAAGGGALVFTDACTSCQRSELLRVDLSSGIITRLTTVADGEAMRGVAIGPDGAPRVGLGGTLSTVPGVGLEGLGGGAVQAAAGNTGVVERVPSGAGAPAEVVAGGGPRAPAALHASRTAATAALQGLAGIAPGPGGSVEIADSDGIGSVRSGGRAASAVGDIRVVDAHGGISTMLPLPYAPTALARDRQGNLYVGEDQGGGGIVHRITPFGTAAVVAGDGQSGWTGDGGPATGAALGYPAALAVDRAGTLYIADSFDNVVRRVGSDGVITTVAGSGPVRATVRSLPPPTPDPGPGQACGDGQPAAAQANASCLAGPRGVATDEAGDLYIADTGDDRILEVKPSSAVTTLASVTSPLGLAVEPSGRLLAAAGHVVDEVTADGTVSTLAGGSAAPYEGDGGPATSAYLAQASAVAMDAAGDLLIADSGDNRVRRVAGAGLSAHRASAATAPAQGAKRCVAPTQASIWNELTATVSSGAAPPPAFQLAVDPWAPCRIYRATDTQTLQRSTDAGQTWSTVFADHTRSPLETTAGLPGFTASSLHVPAPGVVAMSERGKGDALVVSTDAGATWTQANGGLTGIQGHQVTDVTYAPGNAAVAYATVAEGADAVALYVTRDGGATWSPSLLPPPLVLGQHGTSCGGYGLIEDRVNGSSQSWCIRWLQVQVDPANPGHVWLAVNSSAAVGAVLGARSLGLILASTDYGQTWQYQSSFQDLVYQLLVTRSAKHGLRLYVLTLQDEPSYDSNGPNFAGLVLSEDGGQTWRRTVRYGEGALTRLRGSMVAPDPADPDRMLLVGEVDNHGESTPADVLPTGTVAGSYWEQTSREIRAFVSSDGRVFKGMAPLSEPLVSEPSAGVVSPLLDPQRPVLDPAATLQGDVDGRFYLSLDDTCALPQCPTARSRQSVWRIDPSRAGVPTAPQPVACFFVALCNAPTPPSTAVGGEVTQCALQPPTVSTYFNTGSVTFDGVELLYTNLQDPARGPFQGVIHEVDPITCLEVGQIAVSVDPAELISFAAAISSPRCPRPGHPDPLRVNVGPMSYDTRRGIIWAWIYWVDNGTAKPEPILGPTQSECSGGGGGRAGLFRITVLGSTAVPGRRLAAAHPAFAPRSVGCQLVLSYSYSEDRLWTCGPSVRASDGAPLPSCMDTQLDNSTYVATATAGGPHHLYVQLEDDRAVRDYDPATCALQDEWTHRAFVEPGNEDEQMACDAVTFGSGSNTGSPFSVLWIRDSVDNLVVAYRAPGDCPLPTTTRYLSPTQVVVGDAQPLCAQLTAGAPPRPLPGRLLSIAVEGTTIAAGPSDSQGVACTAPYTFVHQGRLPTRAAFAGEFSYLPSAGEGLVAVLPRGAPGNAAPLPGGLLPGLSEQPPPQPQPLPLLQPVQAPAQVQQAQSAVQAQSTDVQAQVQAQSTVQQMPAAMLQRQRRVQVSTSTLDSLTTSMLATAPRRSPLEPAGAALLLAATLGVLGHRSRRSWAPADRERPALTAASRLRRSARPGG